MKKVIKKWGHSLGLLLTGEEAKAHKLKKDDIVEVELTKVIDEEDSEDGNI